MKRRKRKPFCLSTTPARNEAQRVRRFVDSTAAHGARGLKWSAREHSRNAAGRLRAPNGFRIRRDSDGGFYLFERGYSYFIRRFTTRAEALAHALHLAQKELA